MVGDDPGNERGGNSEREPAESAVVDPEVTSLFPAGHRPAGAPGSEEPDADSWVAQWSGDSSDKTKSLLQDGPGTDPDMAVESDAAEIAAWQKAQERQRRRAKLRANQKRAKFVQRYRPDPREIQTAGPVPVSQRTDTGNGRRLVALGAAALVAALAAIGYVFMSSGIGFGGSGEDAVGSAAGAQNELLTSAPLEPRGIQELALSTVQLVGLNNAGQPECAGSGIIVTDGGTILTNAHVVTRSEACEFSTIGVGVAASSTSPAQLLYRAEVLGIDPALDLAVLRVVGLLNPDSGIELPESFPRAPLGDSDTVALGDDVRILGFPVIGGETITLTTGSVSGFTSQVGIGERALIKTDAAISAGNSGGMALDAEGRVVGIPTKARANESGPAIDCRPLADTNDDGVVDSDDNCVPVGGFLNGIRPINLAIPLLERSISAEPIGPPEQLPVPNPDFDPDAVVMTNPRFATDKEGNQPLGETITVQAGIPQLCFFVDWSGIPAGVAFEGAWFIDGDHERAFGDSEQPWNLAEAGRNFWLCAEEQNALGLPAGSYELGFFLEGRLMFAEGIILTDSPVEVVTVTWVNDTEVDLCGLAVNPITGSGQVGLNELAADEVIAPGETREMDLPIGTVVVEAYDCEGQAVADAADGLVITGPEFFSISL